MQNPKNMTLLSLMLEYERLSKRYLLTETEKARKIELRKEIKQLKQGQIHA